MNRLVRKTAIALAALAMMVFGVASPAKADTITLQLTNGSSLPDQLYGSITLTLNGAGGIDVLISMINGNKIIQTGQDVAVGFNSSLSPNPTISASNFNPATGYSLISGTPNNCPGACHANGFGNFEYGISSIYNASGGAASATSVLSFTITKSGGFASVNALIENSTGGGEVSSWAVDIFCPTCTAGAQTGFVGVGTTAVPEPNVALLLLTSGGVGLGARLVRRRKKA